MKLGSVKEGVPPPKFGAKNRQAVLEGGLFGNKRGAPVEDSSELQRILALPRRPQIDTKSITALAIVERETQKYRLDRTGMGPCRCKEIDPDQGCITRLLPVQAILLREMSMAGGVIGSISVGGGKTFCGIIGILALGLKRERKEQGLLLVPSSLMEQLTDNYQLLAEHFKVPEIVVHMPGKDWTRRVPNEPVLHVMAHSMISLPQYSTFLEDLNPHAILIDEIDAFSALGSSRTLRLDRFLDENPGKLFAGWTGSLWDKSFTECAHLFAYAFGDKSSLPTDDKIMEDWCRCLDAVDFPCKPGALMQFVEDQDEGEDDIERVRSAIRRRLSDTLGFIVSGSAEVFVMGADGVLTDRLVQLEIEEHHVEKIPDIVQEGLTLVRNWERPDMLAGSRRNDPILDPLMQSKYAREVACGMFYRYKFPRGEAPEVIDEYFAAKKDFFSELREERAKGQRKMDSVKLCEDAAKRYWGDIPMGTVDTVKGRDGQMRQVDNRDAPLWKSEAWPRWRDVMDTVEPEQEACRLHPFMAEAAAQWGLDNRGLVWYTMVEMGVWISELSGLPVHDGGAGAGRRIIEAARNQGTSLVASIKSHGRGRNGLQHNFSKQFVLNTLSSNKLWEQLIGRAHRNGQKSDVVSTVVCLHTPELKKSFDQALRRSDRVEDYFTQRQKLRLAIPGS
jgi:hypothetical protein